MLKVHISESEAVDDFAGIMARVRAGTTFIIDSPGKQSVEMMPIERYNAEVAAKLRKPTM